MNCLYITNIINTDTMDTYAMETNITNTHPVYDPYAGLLNITVYSRIPVPNENENNNPYNIGQINYIVNNIVNITGDEINNTGQESIDDDCPELVENYDDMPGLVEVHEDMSYLIRYGVSSYINNNAYDEIQNYLSFRRNRRNNINDYCCKKCKEIGRYSCKFKYQEQQ